MTAHRQHPRAATIAHLDNGARLELYKTAHEEGRALLDSQFADLNTMRQRVVQFMALIASATAFLVGSSAQGATTARDTHPFLVVAAGSLSIVALLCFCGTLFNVAIVIHPYKPFTNMKAAPRGIHFISWKKGVMPNQLVSDWIDEERAGGDEARYYRGLAMSYGDYWQQNEYFLRQLRLFYWTALASGLSGLLCWIVVVWLG